MCPRWRGALTADVLNALALLAVALAVAAASYLQLLAMIAVALHLHLLLVNRYRHTIMQHQIALHWNLSHQITILKPQLLLHPINLQFYINCAGRFMFCNAI